MIINGYTISFILIILIAIDIPIRILNIRKLEKKIQQEKIVARKIDEFKIYIALEEKRFNEAKECEITQRYVDGKVKVTKYFKEN
ncbi:hypothetical protein CYK70_09580 [Clostridium perfringens]|uniref:hypothetical protein n=1 Tax=Clostridium perfringens TaxID=1502 RepID=UPI000D71439B|nr:hypothetical protein [Clostridium perfringens]PWX07534.1 hypothetical protein CYK70_09580 [Clostridium perfringens]